MGKIILSDMAFFAYHGCFSEEQQIGNQFVVNLSFDYDTTNAEISDDLNEAIDYQTAYQVVEAEMKKTSKLLEHLGHRIINALKETFPSIFNITLRVSKLNPPIGGKMHAVSVELKA